jgi:hypothetical protein
LSRKFVLVWDLRRRFLLRAGVYLLIALIFREPMTRHDARLSAMRAFSFSEVRGLAVRAGKISSTKNFASPGRRFGWEDDPNAALHDFAFEAVLEISGKYGHLIP